MPTQQTLNQWEIGLANYCASMPMEPFLLITRRASRESPVLLPALIARFGRSDCAIPLPLRSSREQVVCSSTTLDKTPGRRSMMASLDQTMDGASVKAPVHLPTQIFGTHYSSTIIR